jgi:hypothetical protein
MTVPYSQIRNYMTKSSHHRRDAKENCYVYGAVKKINLFSTHSHQLYIGLYCGVILDISCEYFTRSIGSLQALEYFWTPFRWNLVTTLVN